MSVTGQRVRVLIVDDSAFMRKVLQSIIATDPGLEIIGEARDGREAIAMAESLRPDVISMDIMMPHVDGLQATEAIMSKSPRPIVIVSSEARDGAESTLRALELGAIDFVPKPSSGIDLDMNSIRDEICRKLKLAARVRVVRTAKSFAAPVQAPPENNPYTKSAIAGNGSNGNGNGTSHAAKGNGTAPKAALGSVGGRHPLVVIASSTGGPQTLMQLIPAIPRDFMGTILLVQHMPGTFTSQFSKQLGEVSGLHVKEAAHGDELRPGTIYVCPGSHHLRVSGAGRIDLHEGERINGYRPCADLALETAAAFAGPMCVGVILTGMGGDGAKGVQAVKAAGGFVIAQDEATSVIFGMPAEAIKTGAVDQVLGIDSIANALEKRTMYLMGASKVGAM
jgi:two-component system, chemotaxis family, protein-glutamate methylesterase/glutaminase